MEWTPLGGGYTPVQRWRVRLAEGSSAFVKQGLGVAAELRVYGALEASFLPRCLGFDSEQELLVLEDLSDAHWPPPYPAHVSALFEALGEVARTPAPSDLPPLSRWDRPEPGWTTVRHDPGPFLGLGLCSAEWLEHALETLEAAERRASSEGDALVHNDVYSGNLCFADRGAVLVDWSEAARGSPLLDLAFAVLDLRCEGVPSPAVDFPDEGAWAARLAGLWAVEAPAPLPSWAAPDSKLREEQTRGLGAALQWAAETLGLRPPQDVARSR